MTIRTIADAFGLTKALHRGRDVDLFAKRDWWCKQLGPDNPFDAAISTAWGRHNGVLSYYPVRWVVGDHNAYRHLRDSLSRTSTV